MPGTRLLTIGLLGTVSAAAFESLAVATIMPAAVGEIGGLAYYGWAFSGFMLAQIIGICAAGRLADAGRLTGPFAIGALGFGAGLLAAGLAASMPALIAARVVQGVGAGVIQSLAYVAVARGYAEDARPRMLALLSTAWVAPGLIGPALAGAIAQYVGWRWVFLALAPLMLGAAALVVPALHRLPRTGSEPAAQSPLAAAFGLALAGALALQALQSSSRLAVLAGAGAAVMLAVPALRRLLPAGTLVARSGQPAAVAVLALLSAAFFGAEVFVPLAITDVRGQTTGMAGLVLTAATILWTAGAWLQERVVQRFSRRQLTGAGLAAMTAGIAATSAVLSAAVPPWFAIPTWGRAGMGIGIAYSTLALVVLETAPQGAEGAASAALQLAFVVGTAVGTGATGAAVARAVASGQPLAVALLLVFAAAFILAAFALLLASRLPGEPKRRLRVEARL